MMTDLVKFKSIFSGSGMGSPASYWCLKLITVYCLCLVLLISSNVSLNTRSTGRATAIIGVFLLAAFAASYLLVWRSLVTRPSRCLAQLAGQDGRPRAAPRVALRLWAGTLFVFLLMVHLSIPYMVFMGRVAEVRPVPFVLFSCLGCSLIVAVITAACNALEVVLKSTVLRSWDCALSAQLWLHVAKIVVVVVVAGTMTAKSLANGVRGPVVKPVQLPVRKLPSSMDGLRVVQLSDIHLGPTVGRVELQHTVEVVNSLEPDVVVLTGDLVDSTVENLEEAARPLKYLRAAFGVYFVSGNHEYYTYDVKNWEAFLGTLGVTCLPNRSVKIWRPERPQDWFYLAGTNDLQANSVYQEEEDRFNLARAMEGTDEDHAVILLAHQPKVVEHVVRSPYDISLILLGHTHGGQMFPINILAYFTYPYFAGIYQPRDGLYIYISSGTWYNGPPMRLFSQAEITLISLLAS